NLVSRDREGCDRPCKVAVPNRAGELPLMPGAIQNQLGGIKKAGTNSFADAFVTTLNAAGSGLLFSTYLGGTGDALWDGRIGLSSAWQEDVKAMSKSPGKV